jgi:alpha-mannosidase
MNDNNMPSGESIAHQLLLGKTYFRDNLNCDVKTGWALGSSELNAQMPQLLKLAGLEFYWFQRAVPGVDTPSEFCWEGIDGTRMAAFWLPLAMGTSADMSRESPPIRALNWASVLRFTSAGAAPRRLGSSGDLSGRAGV